jgi:hypothetical protein
MELSQMLNKQLHNLYGYGLINPAMGGSRRKTRGAAYNPMHLEQLALMNPAYASMIYPNAKGQLSAHVKKAMRPEFLAAYHGLPGVKPMRKRKAKGGARKSNKTAAEIRAQRLMNLEKARAAKMNKAHKGGYSLY